MRRLSRPGAPYLAGAPLLMAHRGGAALAPENTIVAFRQAVEWWNADVLELDVRPTSDGEAVVLHDATVDRTTDGRGSAADHPLAWLQELDAAYRFTPDGGRHYPCRGQGMCIPTLGEVMAAFPDHRINIEIKDGRCQSRVREVIAEMGAEGRVLVAAGARRDRDRIADYGGALSASEEELRAFYLLHRVGLAALFRARVDAFQMPLWNDGKEIVSARLVRDAHAHNLAVHVWTVDDAAVMARLLSWGVDGIVTDRPDRLARVLHDGYGRTLPPGPPADVPSYLEPLLVA